MPPMLLNAAPCAHPPIKSARDQAGALRLQDAGVDESGARHPIGAGRRVIG